MKVCAISDLHGILPKIPECDLLLIAGDICPLIDHSSEWQSYWLDHAFRDWLKNVPARKIVGVAGNHDLIFQDQFAYPFDVPADLPWTYLQDSGIEWEGLNIWGSPWQSPFGSNWAFNLEESKLAKKWDLIPDNTDIIVTHGPVYGYGDYVQRGTNEGSPSLLERVKQIEPKLIVFGHIHNSHGIYKIDGLNTIVANVSIVDNHYDMVHEPTIFEISVQETVRVNDEN